VENQCGDSTLEDVRSSERNSIYHYAVMQKEHLRWGMRREYKQECQRVHSAQQGMVGFRIVTLSSWNSSTRNANFLRQFEFSVQHWQLGWKPWAKGFDEVGCVEYHFPSQAVPPYGESLLLASLTHQQGNVGWSATVSVACLGVYRGR
jgi:hypothetical protein